MTAISAKWSQPPNAVPQYWGTVPKTGHQQRVARVLLECVPGSQDTKEIRLRPPSPYCHTACQHVKGLWEDTCVALLNPSSSPLFVPWMSSHTPRGKKAAVDSDIPKGQNLQGLEVQKRQRLPERVVQIHPTALGWSPLLRDPSLP